MEKTHQMQASLVLMKTKNGYEKVYARINFKAVLRFLLCILMPSASVLGEMSPFGIAIYTAIFCRDGCIVNYVVCCLSYFILYSGSPWLYVLTLTLSAVTMAVCGEKLEGAAKALVPSLSFFALKLVSIIYSGFIAYDLMALAIESALAFAFAYVADVAFEPISDLKGRSFISVREALSISVLISAVMISLSGLSFREDVNIGISFAALFIFILSYEKTYAATVILAVVFSFFAVLIGDDAFQMTQVLPFAALFAVFFSKFGKAGIILGFALAASAFGIFVLDSAKLATVIYSALPSALIFLCLPKKLTEPIGKLSAFGMADAKYTNSIETSCAERLSHRLGDISGSFYELSKAYDSIRPARELGNDYIMHKFGEVINLACVGCPNKTKCFRTADSDGYLSMRKMLETAFKEGRVSPHNMPASFKENCRRSISFADKFNIVFELIKTERLWLGKLNDSRNLMSDQLMAISESLMREQKNCNFVTMSAKEDRLREELDKQRFYPKDISIINYGGDGIVVNVTYKDNMISNDSARITQALAEKVLGTELIKLSDKYRGGCVCYEYCPAKSLRLSFGYCSKAKSGESVSGDNYRIISTDSNHVSAIICDGMGSGKSASEESKLCIDLMEKFMRAGFKSETALKLINSSLLLKSMRDSFSTIDLCTINLANANVNFTKLGSAHSYIHTKSGTQIVKGSSLPAGILKNIELSDTFVPIDSDMTIVMMSDGIADIALKNKEYDGWIEALLQRLGTDNPQIIASKLLDSAAGICKGKIFDDMTAVVINIKKV